MIRKLLKNFSKDSFEGEHEDKGDRIVFPDISSIVMFNVTDAGSDVWLVTPEGRVNSFEGIESIFIGNIMLEDIDFNIKEDESAPSLPNGTIELIFDDIEKLAFIKDTKSIVREKE